MKYKLRYWLIELLYFVINAYLLIYFYGEKCAVLDADTYFLVAAVVVLLVLILTFGPCANRVFVSVYNTLFFSYIDSQKLFFNKNGIYFRFFENRAISTNFGNKEILISIGFSVVFLVVWFFFQRKYNELKTIKYRVLTPALLVVVPLMGSLNKEDIKNTVVDTEFQIETTDYYDYLHFQNDKKFVEKFGLLNYLYEDVKQHYTIDVKREEAIKKVDEYYNTSFDEILQEYMNGIETEEEKTLFNEFYNEFINSGRDYSGIFKDKKLIIIQADKFLDVFVSKELTPNIYRLKAEGIFVDGFYSPAIGNCTANTEFMSNLSLVPKWGNIGLYEYDDNTYPTNLTSLFKDAGYYTYYYHNDYSLYHNREKMVPKYGYDEIKYCVDYGFNGKTKHVDTIEGVKWLAAWADYNNIIYYSAEYNDVVDEENIETIKDKYPNLDEKYYSYLNNAIDMDTAIGTILSEQEAAGTADDYVIVFFGNNIDANSILKESKIAGEGYTIEDTYSGLYIYNNGNYQDVISKNATPVDLIPTIADLFGFTYNNKKLLGGNIFDYKYPGFVFDDSLLPDTYWLSNNLKIDYFYKTDMPEGFQTMFDYMDVAHKILKYDYFKYRNN